MTCDLTIIMPSYNMGEYISEALDSIFMQKTSYSYQVVVADDCSDDNTIEIVKSYQSKYPNKITLLTSETNQKLYKNVLRAYAITKTPYFCVLGPDDYYCSEDFLQKALDFLNQNEDYTIYMSNVYKKMPDGSLEKYFDFEQEYINVDFQDYINGRAILSQTSGCVYRNVIFKDGVPEKLLNPPEKSWEVSFRGDAFRNALHVFYGKAHISKDCNTVYRITDKGIWQGMCQLKRDVFNAIIYRDMYVYFDEKYAAFLNLSYNFFMKCLVEFFDEIENIDNEAEQVKILKDISKLKKYFSLRMDLINTEQKKMQELKCAKNNAIKNFLGKFLSCFRFRIK